MSPNYHGFATVCIIDWDTPSENTGLWQLPSLVMVLLRRVFETKSLVPSQTLAYSMSLCAAAHKGTCDKIWLHMEQVRVCPMDKYRLTIALEPRLVDHWLTTVVDHLEPASSPWFLHWSQRHVPFLAVTLTRKDGRLTRLPNESFEWALELAPRELKVYQQLSLAQFHRVA